MDDKQILRHLLGLGLEKLIERSGGSLQDFIEANNVPKQAEEVAPQPEHDNQSFDDQEHERRFGKA